MRLEALPQKLYDLNAGAVLNRQRSLPFAQGARRKHHNHLALFARCQDFSAYARASRIRREITGRDYTANYQGRSSPRIPEYDWPTRKHSGSYAHVCIWETYQLRRKHWSFNR
jgi:hypothetical protein